MLGLPPSEKRPAVYAKFGLEKASAVVTNRILAQLSNQEVAKAKAAEQAALA